MKQKTLLRGITAFLLVFTLMGCTPAQKQDTGTVITGNNLRVAEIDLPGMFCAGCAQSSKSTFEGMSGVLQATVNIATKKGTVIYDADITTKEALIQEGLIQAYEGKIITDEAYEGE